MKRREQWRYVVDPASRPLPVTADQIRFLTELYWELGKDAPAPKTRGEADDAIKAAKAMLRQRE